MGLAYQGASSTPYRRRDYHEPSSGRRNNGQLSTFQAASNQNDDGVQSISLGTSSSRTKLDNGTGSDSRVAGDDLYDTDRDSGERNEEKEGMTV
jgi:hypothetical protein